MSLPTGTACGSWVNDQTITDANQRCRQSSRGKTILLWALLLLLLLFFLLLLFLVFVRKQKKPVFVIAMAVVLLAFVVVAFYIGRTKTTSGTLAKAGTGLKPGKEYFWKVIAEDGKGGIAESETRRFKTK